MAGTWACGPTGNPAEFLGRWEATLKGVAKPGTPPDIVKSLERVRVDLKPDGSAVVVLMSMPYTGIWRGDSPITVRLTQVLGKPLPAKDVFEVKLDYKQGRVQVYKEWIAIRRISETVPADGT
ncbi:MAG: hypothetical protein JNJ45_04285 [Chthonomonas sp.]|nr:hypothetical protein [Chthonomonas sp.]